MYYSDFSDFWKFVSHGSVATQLKCGGIFNNYLIASCLQNVPVWAIGSVGRSNGLVCSRAHGKKVDV